MGDKNDRISEASNNAPDASTIEPVTDSNAFSSSVNLEMLIGKFIFCQIRDVNVKIIWIGYSLLKIHTNICKCKTTSRHRLLEQIKFSILDLEGLTNKSKKIAFKGCRHLILYRQFESTFIYTIQKEFKK